MDHGTKDGRKEALNLGGRMLPAFHACLQALTFSRLLIRRDGASEPSTATDTRRGDVIDDNAVDREPGAVDADGCALLVLSLSQVGGCVAAAAACC